jgi:hypothetical protein
MVMFSMRLLFSRWNVLRHIASNHYTSTPLLSIRFASKPNRGYDLKHSYNKSTESILTQTYQKECETNLFADNYLFRQKPAYNKAVQYGNEHESRFDQESDNVRSNDSF